MADEQVQQEQTTDNQDSALFPVERTPEVDERLREFGLDLDENESVEEKEEDEEKPSGQATTKTEDTTQAQQQTQEQTQQTQQEETTEEEIPISDEQAQRIIESQTGKKEEDEVYPWEKENREPTQKEVLDYVAQKSADIQEQRRLESQKQEQARQEEARKQQEASIASWQNVWTDNLKFLEDNNYIPKVVDKNDKNDPGVKARTQLHEQAVLHGELDLEKVYFRYVLPNRGKQPAGVKAPVMRAPADTTEKQADDEFYYDEIHGKDPAREFEDVQIS